MILSHGSAFYTLYGHNSSLLVKVGDKVRKGKNAYGNDVDPWTYLK
ncbi:MAG: M23 family metallopeptidase [Firmicutes bacterium]|nr:M23 family metallopeptidase [Bacillota bacterium]